jgi:hypothetical protein
LTPSARNTTQHAASRPFDFVDGPGVLPSDANAVVAVFEDIDIVDDQHRQRRCDRLRNLVIEMDLNSIVFPWAFANEPPDSVLVHSEPFADSTERFVDTWPDQTLDVRWSDLPRVGCSRPR